MRPWSLRCADLLGHWRARRNLAAHGGDDRVEHLAVLAQVILRGLAALADLLAVERQPRAFPLQHAEVGGHVDDRAFFGDADIRLWYCASLIVPNVMNFPLFKP